MGDDSPHRGPVSGMMCTDNVNLNLTPSVNVTLEQPDLALIRQQRMTRNQQTMKNVNPTLAKELSPEVDNASVPQRAAILIQAHYRGHLARKKYIHLLYSQYQQEEAMRLEKTMRQVEEGQLLVENHQLQVQFDEGATCRRNKSRQYLTHVITIQRAWRAYKRRTSHTGPLVDDMCIDGDTASTCSDSSGSGNGAQSMSVSSPEDSSTASSTSVSSSGHNEVKVSDTEDHGQRSKSGTPTRMPVQCSKNALIEPESDSVVSDYSEIADTLKEHLANVQIIRQEDLEAGNTMSPDSFTVQLNVPREAQETQQEYNKRLRKINYLSLAQEFAALKKIDADALPFDLHKGASTPSSDGTDTGDSASPSLVTTPMGDETASILVGPAGLATNMGDSNRNLNTTMGLCPREALDNQGPKVKGQSGPLCEDNMIRKGCVTKDTRQSSLQGTTDTMDTNIYSLSTSNLHQTNLNNKKDFNGAPRKSPPRQTGGSPRGNSQGESPLGGASPEVKVESVGDFDVYNIESTLPQVDWAMLEEQLHRAALEEKEKSQSRRNDREEIRRRLAMATEEEYYGGERAFKKPNLQTRLQGGMNLQICYVNEASTEPVTMATGPGAGHSVSHDHLSTATQPKPCPVDNKETGMVSQPASSRDYSSGRLHTSAQAPPPHKAPPTDTGVKVAVKEKDFFKTQAQLQAEARIALAQARPMAHMQLEVERQLRKKSPIADIVGIPGIGDGKKVQLGPQVLYQMNIAQLQVVVNDLHAQIESLNEELVHLLVERDDLHMEQDSKLVDIEDFTRRAQEVSARMNSTRNKKKDKRK